MKSVCFPAPSSKLRTSLPGTFLQNLPGLHGYATVNWLVLFFSTQLSTDAVSAVRKVRVLIIQTSEERLWKKHNQSSGTVRKSRRTSWAPVLNKAKVSVVVKQHFNQQEIVSRHARKHEASSPRLKERVQSLFKQFWFWFKQNFTFHIIITRH